MRVDGNAVNNNRPAETSAQSIARSQPVPSSSKGQEANGATSAGDSVEISEEARQLMGAQQSSGGDRQIRPEMVERAKAMLISRQYNDRAVLEKTADHIAQSIDLTA